MGLKQQQMGQGFSGAATQDESLSVQLVGAQGGGGVCGAAFHICCLHMGKLTLPLSRRPTKNPIKSSASAQ